MLKSTPINEMAAAILGMTLTHPCSKDCGDCYEIKEMVQNIRTAERTDPMARLYGVTFRTEGGAAAEKLVANF